MLFNKFTQVAKKSLVGARMASGFNAYTPPTAVPRQSNKVMKKNAVVAFVLLGFTGGVYYTAISKMRPEQDELGRIIDEMNPSSSPVATKAK